MSLPDSSCCYVPIDIDWAHSLPIAMGSLLFEITEDVLEIKRELLDVLEACTINYTTPTIL